MATDLDGTLLRTDGTVSDRSVAALRAVAAAGVVTVLVTARPPRWLHDLAHVVGDHGVAICSNGAYVYDVGARRVVESHGFEREATLALVRDLRAALPGARFLAERASGPWMEPAYPDPHQDRSMPGVVCRPMDDLDEEPVGKLLAFVEGAEVESFLRLVGEVVGDRGVLAYSGAFGLAEINPPGVTKAVALARWSAARGIAAEEVWAFGDMPNDVPMLAWAGRSFAVANGHPDAIAAASDLCPANDDDGVAVTLEGLVKGMPLNH